MSGLQVNVKRHHPDAVLPHRKHGGDAGWDLVCCQSTLVAPRMTGIIPTGLAIAPSPGFWARIVTRSSTLKRHGLMVVDAVIDNGYRGELFVQAYNVTDEGVWVDKGTRIAQLIFHEIPHVWWMETEELPNGDRGVQGFGSTGA